MAFLIIVGVLLMASNPALGLVLIAGVILFLAGRRERSSSAGSFSSAVYSEIRDAEPASAKGETGMFYRGTCTALTSPIYSYRDGYVFKGVNYGTDLLNFYEYTYSGGFVRDRANCVVGRYRDGFIWLGFSDAWTTDAKACYARGYVHEGTYVPDLYVGNAIGTYTGDDEGAAACAIAMLLNG